MNKLALKVLAKTREGIENVNKAYMAAIITVFTVVINSMPVFAATKAASDAAAGKFENSSLAKGTTQLFTDIGKWLLILAPIVGGTVGVYFFIRRSAADEMDQKKWNDRIKVTIVSTIGATLVSALITLFVSYYSTST